MKKHRFRILFFLICLAVATTTPILRYYAFDIYAWYWHIRHGESINWNGLRIQIPDKLIAQTAINVDGTTDIEIYYPAKPNQVYIVFKQVSYHLVKDFDFEKKHACAGYRIIEQKSSSISGNPCVWIKAIKEGQDPIYSERIYFSSKDIEVLFIGYSDSRHYLDDILSTLQVKQ
jgi:hypothetical protein